MKGCSSLGRLRYAVLVGVSERTGGDNLCLIDIKEGVRAGAPGKGATDRSPRKLTKPRTCSYPYPR
jgi:uncharacterized protein (DUF2252 family)